MYDKFTASITFSGERLIAVPLRSRQDKGSTHHSYLTQYESSSLSNQAMKKHTKGIRIRMQELNLALFTDEVILHPENPQDFIKNCKT